MQKDKYITWSDLYEEFKIVQLIETQSKMVASRGGGRRKWGGISQKVQSFSYARWISPRDLLYSILPVNNTVLYT